MKLCVVIPTFNECGTIERTLGRLLNESSEYHALVVDDASPDGTADRVRAMQKSERRIHLLCRANDRGFGTAVRDGMVEALRLGAELVGQMDADGSHDPAMFHSMRSLINAGSADVVIGSRYVYGSRIVGWKPWRYVNSHVANGLARWITGLPLRDATNGLRVFRRDVLENLPLARLLSPGYSVILETNYRAHKAGYRFHELPITFHPREAGTSKMGLREIARYCAFLFKLRRQPVSAVKPRHQNRIAA